MNKQKLTPREQQVAAFLVQGMQEKEIAGRLRLHPGTVRNHMKTLYRKLDVENHAAAIRALSSGFNMPSSLTGLEAKIFDLAAMGYQSKEIGKALSISTSMISWHLTNIYAKLGVANRVQAVALCAQTNPQQVAT